MIVFCWDNTLSTLFWLLLIIFKIILFFVSQNKQSVEIQKIRDIVLKLKEAFFLSFKTIKFYRIAQSSLDKFAANKTKYWSHSGQISWCCFYFKHENDCTKNIPWGKKNLTLFYPFSSSPPPQRLLDCLPILTNALSESTLPEDEKKNTLSDEWNDWEKSPVSLYNLARCVTNWANPVVTWECDKRLCCAE